MDYNKLSDILLYDYELDLTSTQIFTLLDLINDYNVSVYIKDYQNNNNRRL